MSEYLTYFNIYLTVPALRPLGECEQLGAVAVVGAAIHRAWRRVSLEWVSLDVITLTLSLTSSQSCER